MSVEVERAPVMYLPERFDCRVTRVVAASVVDVLSQLVDVHSGGSAPTDQHL